MRHMVVACGDLLRRQMNIEKRFSKNKVFGHA